ncbi:MAG: NAD(P)-dependent oxidoreductase, partial [Myxococcaceae bacterium]
MRQIKTVGFIGLGIMGSRMAKNLKAKGFDVVVWNRTEEKAKPLRALGIEVAAAPSDLAANVDCICTCVSDPKALREVTWGEHGIFQSASRGQLFVDFSTVSPDFSRDLFKECESRGVDFVEAPVTGSKSGAEKGTLVLMVGATDAGVARAEPIFKAVGEKWIHCGPVGSASQVKLAGNAIIALMLEALSEAMLLTKKAGVDPR